MPAVRGARILNEGVEAGPWPSRRGPATRDRRVADQGDQDRQLPRRRLHRRVQPRARPRPADRRAEVPAKYKVRSGPGPASTWTTASSRSTWSSPDKRATLRSLKDALGEADELLLATDGDREGEAIAWHLLQELKPKVPARRMVFHEITRSAIAGGGGQPARPGPDLVDAQETRRILDRLYGYEVSPVLWKKVMPRLSAGRVQSVATRLVVDRERERIAFRSAVVLGPGRRAGRRRGAEPPLFPARLTRVGERRVAQGRDFDSRGQLAAGVRAAAAPGPDPGRGRWPSLQTAAFAVDVVESKPYTRRPYAPFRTTTLQQEAGRKLGFTAQRAMSVAQDLYEAGFITYMRTDSVTLSDTAITAARSPGAAAVRRRLPARPAARLHQQGQERPGGARGDPAGRRDLPDPGADRLTGDQFRLYELIWMRTIASQMKDAEGRRSRSRSTRDRPLVKGGTPRPSKVPAPSSPPAGPSPSTASSRPTSSRSTTPSRPADDAQTRLPNLVEGQPLRPESVTASGTRPARRPATPSRRWWPSWRSWRSAGPRRTRRSSAPSPRATTCSRRARRWSRPGWPSPSPGCWRSTSRSWSTTRSPPRWRRCWTRSPAATPSGSRC